MCPTQGTDVFLQYRVLLRAKRLGNGGEGSGWEHGEANGTYLGRGNVCGHSKSGGGS